MQIALLLLAAGSSARMRGADKLLMEVAGQPCLRTMARRGLAALDAVYVTLPAHAPRRRAALDGLAVTIVPVPDAGQGMSRSLIAGINALPAGTDAVLILPADMPDITADDLAAIAGAWRADPSAPILRAATEDGRGGHPILFSRALFDRFDRLSGDRGAISLVREEAGNTRLFPLSGQRARRDLDTPEDWADWRAGQAGKARQS